MSDVWRYRLGGEEFGPVDESTLRDLLRRGEIGPKTPVWSESLDDWTPIGALDRFTESAKTLESSLEKIEVVDTGYAPIWKRALAFAADLLILGIAELYFGNLGAAALVAQRHASASPGTLPDFRLVEVGLFVFPWLYFTLFEGSRLQATPGKLLMRISVTDLDGCAPGYLRAARRALGKYVSWYFVFLGFVIAPFTERKQALHDYIARTIVLDG